MDEPGLEIKDRDAVGLEIARRLRAGDRETSFALFEAIEDWGVLDSLLWGGVERREVGSILLEGARSASARADSGREARLLEAGVRLGAGTKADRIRLGRLLAENPRRRGFFECILYVEALADFHSRGDSSIEARDLKVRLQDAIRENPLWGDVLLASARARGVAL